MKSGKLLKVSEIAKMTGESKWQLYETFRRLGVKHSGKYHNTKLYSSDVIDVVFAERKAINERKAARKANREASALHEQAAPLVKSSETETHTGCDHRFIPFLERYQRTGGILYTRVSRLLCTRCWKLFTTFGKEWTPEETSDMVIDEDEDIHA
jgi:hypothetical protein